MGKKQDEAMGKIWPKYALIGIQYRITCITDYNI